MNVQDQTASYQKQKQMWLAFGIVGMLCIIAMALIDTPLAIEKNLSEQSQLAVNPSNDNNIHVVAKGNQIVLTGSVTENSQRQVAMNAIMAIPGIRTVTDELTLVELTALTEPDQNILPKINPIDKHQDISAKIDEAIKKDDDENKNKQIGSLSGEKIKPVTTKKNPESLPEPIQRNEAKLVEAVSTAMLDQSSLQTQNITVPQVDEKQRLRESLSNIAVEKILFQSSKAKITAASTPVVKQLGELLKSYPTISIIIAGHTDSSGNKQSNLKLSQKRADAVKDYLVKHYIGEERISAKGYGQTRPIVSNATPAGRALNRRIEIDF